MPAERTRGSRRAESDGNQLVWTMPVEPSAPNAIAFAPNLTPCTFNDPPPLVDPPTCDSILFPPPEDCSASRRPAHSKKKPENHIPRPPNAFILFRSSFIKSQHVSTEVETNHSTLSKIIGLTWQNLPHEERQVWHSKAKAALEEHKRKFPQYAFRPLHTKGKAPEKRKVREVGPKDLKRCAKIAELLVQGKKGSELDAAIQEFDRHHVPEVVTRFEAPLTARQYRRSSSVPALDSPPQPASVKKVRSVSSQPTRHSTPSAVDVPQTLQAASDVLSTYDQVSSPAPFVSEPNPSFNFDSFSFDSLVNDANNAGLFTHSTATPALTVDTMGAWTRSPSPMSSLPTTPQSYADSPYEAQTPIDICSSFTPGYSVDQYEQNAISTFGASPLQIFPGECTNSYPQYVQPNYAPLPDHAFAYGHAGHAKPELAQLDLDLSAFMANIPTTTYTL